MSICCAFSFSLIIFFVCFVLFSLGWGGGSVCWCSEFFFFLFGRLLPEKLGFFSSCSSFTSTASTVLRVCIHCWRRTRPLARSS